MSQSAMTVGCPHCGTASTVDMVTTNGDASRPDEERLKGRRVDCHHCGGGFSFYHY
ncbi:hypothetical protein [Haladaptatus halobius]|uniref:hypothetical protein n=1 Tax=Haladaptatus halobius TaxID=2884875 RepID=UPI001D0B7BB7|nr:hypothetical protein [Haladaptatus halobius]